MAINLKDFENEIEYRLPIIILVDESGFDNEINTTYYSINNWTHKTNHLSIPSLAYMATMIEKLNEELVVHNIRGSLAIISYGDKVSFRYPVLKEDEGPKFINIEDNDVSAMCSEIIKIEQSKTAVLGTALKLTKAIIEDTDTINFDCYEPIVIILAAGQPSSGWEGAYTKLAEEGISSCSKIYYVDMNNEPNIPKEITDSFEGYCSCQLDKDEILQIDYSNVSESRWYDNSSSEIGIKNNEAKLKILKDLIEKARNLSEFRQEYNTFANKFGKQFYYRKEIQINTSANGDNKKTNDTIVKHDRTMLFADFRDKKDIFNGTDIISDIVSKFTYEPMKKEPKEVKVEVPKVAIPSDTTNHGDNPNAVGNGFI